MESSNSTSDRFGDPARSRGAALSPLSRADLGVLGALLALTATFGKGFSTIGFDDASIYVTEVALALAGGLALLRLGPAGFVEAVRTRLPLVPLAIFWVAAVVAAIEGIRRFGLKDMIEDIGLGEYSLLLLLIAAVAGSLARTELLTRILALGLVAGTLVYAVSDASVRLFDASETFFDVQEITFGLYMSMLVAYVAARLLGGGELNRMWVAAGALALLLVFLTNARGVWISVVVGLAVVALLSPPGRRLRAGGAVAATAVCAFALAVGIQIVGGDSQIAREVTGTVRGLETSDPDADDDGVADPAASVGGTGGGTLGTNDTVTYEESDNARWRIAFWTEIVSRSVENPVFGVGYGEPIAFTWEGGKYDFRDGDPNAIVDVDGPHNEYLHILYRMGYVGLGALIALMIVALVRVRRALAVEDLDPGTRSLIVALTAMWLASASVAFFADALKAPFLALFFWASLGLLFAALAGAGKGEGSETRA